MHSQAPRLTGGEPGSRTGWLLCRRRELPAGCVPTAPFMDARRGPGRQRRRQSGRAGCAPLPPATNHCGATSRLGDSDSLPDPLRAEGSQLGQGRAILRPHSLTQRPRHRRRHGARHPSRKSEDPLPTGRPSDLVGDMSRRHHGRRHRGPPPGRRRATRTLRRRASVALGHLLAPGTDGPKALRVDHRPRSGTGAGAQGGTPPRVSGAIDPEVVLCTSPAQQGGGSRRRSGRCHSTTSLTNSYEALS